MARDYIEIGATPSCEGCEQLGPNYDSNKAMKECRVFIDQLRRELGPEPFGARLAIKANSHDFGTYYEVICYFEDTNEEATEYAFWCERECPSYWDEDAKVLIALNV
jgi:hypothetical protein